MSVNSILANMECILEITGNGTSSANPVNINLKGTRPINQKGNKHNPSGPLEEGHTNGSGGDQNVKCQRNK